MRYEHPEPSINIEYAEIKYAELGVFYQLNKPFKIKNCMIGNCNIGVNSESKITQIMDTKFLNNNQGAIINDGILNLVKRCEFRENKTGLSLKGEEGEIKRLGDNETRRQGEIEQCSGLIYQTTDEFLKQLQDMVQNDKVEQGGEKGQMTLVFDNLIVDNDTGIVFSDYAIGMVRKNEITNNLIGVYITENAWPILGIKMSGQNRIEIRSQKLDVRSQEQSYAVYNNTKNYILAEGNWWGTNDKDSIALFIWDYYDDTTKGIVDFIPYRQYSLAKSGEGGIQSNSTENIKGFNLWLSSLVKGKGILMLCAAGEKIRALVEIYDVSGRLVKKSLVAFEPGYKEYKIGCENLADGVYFIQIKTYNECITKKFVVVR